MIFKSPSFSKIHFEKDATGIGSGVCGRASEMYRRSVKKKFDKAALIVKDESLPLRTRLISAYMGCLLRIQPEDLLPDLVVPFQQLRQALTWQIEASQDNQLVQLFRYTRQETLEELAQEIICLADRYKRPHGTKGKSNSKSEKPSA